MTGLKADGNKQKQPDKTAGDAGNHYPDLSGGWQTAKATTTQTFTIGRPALADLHRLADRDNYQRIRLSRDYQTLPAGNPLFAYLPAVARF